MKNPFECVVVFNEFSLFFRFSPTNENSSPETKKTKSRAKTKTNEEKKKVAAPRTSKKKGATTTTPVTVPSNNEDIPTTSTIPSAENTTKEEKSTELPPTSPSKRRMSGTESEEVEENNADGSTRAINGKSDQESDSSTTGMNPNPTATNAPEKKGGRTTIKPQQLEVSRSEKQNKIVLFSPL